MRRLNRLPFLKLTIDQTGSASYAFPKLAGIITLYPIPNSSSLSSQLGSVFDSVSFDSLNGSQGDPLPLYPNFIFEFHFAQGVSAIQISGNSGDSYTMFFSTQLPSVTNVHAYPVGTSFSAITGQAAPIATFQNDFEGFFSITNPSINFNAAGAYIEVDITLQPNDYIVITDLLIGSVLANPSSYGNLFDSNLKDDIGILFNIWATEQSQFITVSPTSTYHGFTNRIWYNIANSSTGAISTYVYNFASDCLCVAINYARPISNQTSSPQTYYIRLYSNFMKSGVNGSVSITMFYQGLTNPNSTITATSSSGLKPPQQGGGGGYYPHGIRIG